MTSSFSYGEDNDGWYIEKDGEQVAFGATQEWAKRLVTLLNKWRLSFSFENGGPAFPHTVEKHCTTTGVNWIEDHGGMTLHDYFMAHAPIQVSDANEAFYRENASNPRSHVEMLDALANLRSKYADAMLASKHEREEKEGELERLREVVERLKEAANESNRAQYGTLSTNFVLGVINANGG